MDKPNEDGLDLVEIFLVKDYMSTWNIGKNKNCGRTNDYFLDCAVSENSVSFWRRNSASYSFEFKDIKYIKLTDRSTSPPSSKHVSSNEL
jgi:hypothetical protein